MTYSKKLRDPRWQKKRLEIMQKYDFTCEGCGTVSETLNVHHAYYKHGLEPWEYPDEDMVVLCDKCHEQWHSRMIKIQKELCRNVGLMDSLLGFIDGLEHRHPAESDNSHEYCEAYSLASLRFWDDVDAMSIPAIRRNAGRK